MRDAHEIERDIRAFVPIDGNWRPLDALIAEAATGLPPREAIRILLGLFERFSFDDGAGVMWSALHAIEHIGGYEAALLESVRQTPSKFGTAMLGRLANSGQQRIGSTTNVEVFAELAVRQNIASDARSDAEKWLRKLAPSRESNGLNQR